MLLVKYCNYSCINMNHVFFPSMFCGNEPKSLNSGENATALKKHYTFSSKLFHYQTNISRPDKIYNKLSRHDLARE